MYILFVIRRTGTYTFLMFFLLVFRVQTTWKCGKVPCITWFGQDKHTSFRSVAQNEMSLYVSLPTECNFFNSYGLYRRLLRSEARVKERGAHSRVSSA